MIKPLLIILTILFSINIYAQNDTKTDKKSRKSDTKTQPVKKESKIENSSSILIDTQQTTQKDTTKEVVKINWLTLEEALALNKENPKKIFIDVYTNWCGWCKVMDRETFTHSQIASYINEKFYPVKFNAEQSEGVTYNNKTYNYIVKKDTVTGKTSKYHEMAVFLLNGKLSYPSFAFLDEKNKLLFSVAGYMKPKQLEPVIAYVGDNGYLTPHWELYLKSFQSKIIE